MADTLALYERILSLLKPAELHLSCNGVLQDEYAALQHAVDESVAAFAKVEEVRDAVNQLEQGKPSTGRSASLMEAMDAAMQPQKDLKKKLEQVAAGMQVEAPASGEKKEKKEKRKRSEKVKEKQEKEKEGGVCASPSTPPSSEEEEKEVKKKEKKKPKRAKVDDKEENDSGNGKMSAYLAMAHDALKAISKVKTVNKRMQFDTVNAWAEALFDLKRILKHQAGCDASTTDKPAAEVAARALEAAAGVFQKLEWNGEHVKEVRSVIAALTDACSKNEQLRVYFHRARAQLESLEMSIPASATETEKSGPRSLENGLRIYRALSFKIQKLSCDEKPACVLEALGVIREVLKDDTTCARKEELRNSVETVRGWMSEAPLRNDLAQEYLRFVGNVRGYSKRLGNQVGWQRLVMSLQDLLDERSMLKRASQPSKTTTVKQGQLKSLLGQVEEWQDGIFSLDQLDKVMKELNGVVSYHSMDWKPLADPTVHICVEKLRSCIQHVKKNAHRDKRLKMVNKWMASIDKHQH
ncbi:hypothetical protein PR003_g5595 [Phytophthora rubi]|uniref:Uncharacterized protein n=1 Tax=Phytophthora rubi TaxID=129364 RepID=A0A6A3NBJ2_9STRA|nr:hypothetical protein PR002_g5919 [Phytophthora rubi]KAE9044528.1 hypothetical protein PR001_g5322 [Phytophthora rubi]KAE9349972.1 hypothetical protein PR003_g5595 [Phytophthora rubi]